MRTQSDTIDLANVLRVLRRGWREIAIITAAGTLAALAVVLFAPRRFEGSATVLVRSSDPSASLLSQLGVGAEVGAAASGGLLSGGRSTFESELQILGSRALAEAVIDSLRLQARVRSPAGIPSASVVSDLQLAPAFKKRRYRVERLDGDRYRISGNGESVDASAGVPARVAVGSLTLSAPTAQTPRTMQLELLDREDVLKRFMKRYRPAKAGGEVARIVYSGDDSITAAAVPNVAITEYLARRKTVDRGVNQHRAEFLTAKLDSVEAQLATAEGNLRRVQEGTGVLDPTISAKLALERGSEIRAQLLSIDVELGALNQLLLAVKNGTMSARQIGAFPTFIKSPAIADLLQQLATVSTEREKLLATRTEAEPNVQALTTSMKMLEGQLEPIAQSYAAALTEQRADLNRALNTVQGAIASLPATSEAHLRLQREVTQLSLIHGALRAQLVQARLAAIGEGGEVRQIDVALPSKKPSFPEPWSTMGLGVSGGLFIGVVVALLMALMGRWVRDPEDIERATGVPALRFEHGAPLLIGNGAATTRTVLVIPLDGAAAGLVARHLTETALARSASGDVHFLDLSATTTQFATNVIGGGQSVAKLRELEQGGGIVIVQLGSLSDPVTAAVLHETRPVVLVTPFGRAERARVVGAVDTLRRLNVPCAGIVMAEQAALTAG